MVRIPSHRCSRFLSSLRFHTYFANHMTGQNRSDIMIEDAELLEKQAQSRRFRAHGWLKTGGIWWLNSLPGLIHLLCKMGLPENKSFNPAGQPSFYSPARCKALQQRPSRKPSPPPPPRAKDRIPRRDPTLLGLPPKKDRGPKKDRSVLLGRPWILGTNSGEKARKTCRTSISRKHIARL